MLGAGGEEGRGERVVTGGGVGGDGSWVNFAGHDER